MQQGRRSAATMPVRSPAVSPVDFTPQIRQIQRNRSHTSQLLEHLKLVTCFGNRALLSLFVGTVTRPGQLAGAATTEQEGLALLERHRPDLLLVTDQLEQGCGFRLVEECKAHHPEVRVLLFVGRVQRPAKLRAAVQAGCDGLCLESGLGLDAGTAALRAIRDGGIYIDRPLSELLRTGGSAQGSGLLPVLSAREIEVIELVVAGLKNHEIAARLYISRETVKSHLTNLLNKLGARDRHHAGFLAAQLGLVDWPQEG
jgi:DNA-binding NarL/FixJ family response regulator